MKLREIKETRCPSCNLILRKVFNPIKVRTEFKCDKCLKEFEKVW